MRKAEGFVTKLTSDVVAAYLSRNEASTADVAQLLKTVHATLKKFAAEEHVDPASATRPANRSKPAVPVSYSIQPEGLICLDCGLRFRSLKYHLAHAHGLTPMAYRARWGLPDDYPTTAPKLSEKRSVLACESTFGKHRKNLKAAPRN